MGTVHDTPRPETFTASQRRRIEDQVLEEGLLCAVPSCVRRADDGQQAVWLIQLYADPEPAGWVCPSSHRCDECRGSGCAPDVGADCPVCDGAGEVQG